MEVELVHHYLEFMLPFFNIFSAITKELLGFKVRTEEFQSIRNSKRLLFWLILRSQYLKDGIESYHESFFDLSVIRRVVED